MANTNLNLGEPGIAGIQSGTFTGPREFLASDDPTPTTSVKVGENVDLPVLSVVSYNGSTIALANQANGDAFGILTAPVKTGAGESTTVAVYRAGKFLADALHWDASFATDEQKEDAFKGTDSPTIFIITNKFKDEAYL